MEKVFISNHKGQKLAILSELASEQKGLAFVMHGLGGSKDIAQIKAFAQCFLDAGITTVRFDTTNASGESDGTYEDATLTNYYEDLEDVIAWAKSQPWYQEPFVLVGHSLGGMSVVLYAEKYPEKVKALVPMAPVVSGRLSFEARENMDAGAFKKWEETGWNERPSTSIPGLIRRLPWSHMVDRLKYDTLPNAYKLTMPVLIAVGDKDTFTPVAQVQKLFDTLPGPKEMHVINGSPHEFKGQYLEQVKVILSRWIQVHLHFI